MNNPKIIKDKIKPKSKDGKKPNSATHLYYDHKNLSKIPLLNLSNVCVYYLHNNDISQITNLDSSQLSVLHLQNNSINNIENLEKVPHVKKLYLGNNEISVLEGLETLTDLQELHVEKQFLPIGTSLCFEPRTINSIAKSLRVLDISDNAIESLSPLAPLRHLQTINATNNKLNDLDELCNILKSWFYLTNARFGGNPISRRHRYREDIIASAYCLEILDDKNITANTRNFIKRFEGEKLKKFSRPSINLADTHPDLPRNYPTALQKAVSASIIHKKAHIFGPLETQEPRQIPHRRPKVLQKKNTTTNPLYNVNVNYFPGSFSYKTKLFK